MAIKCNNVTPDLGARMWELLCRIWAEQEGKVITKLVIEKKDTERKAQ